MQNLWKWWGGWLGIGFVNSYVGTTIGRPLVGVGIPVVLFGLCLGLVVLGLCFFFFLCCVSNTKKKLSQGGERSEATSAFEMVAFLVWCFCDLFGWRWF